MIFALISLAFGADTLALRGAVDGPVLATTGAYTALTLWVIDDRAPVLLAPVPPGGIDAPFAGRPEVEGAVPLASDLLAFGGVGVGVVGASLYGALHRGPGADGRGRDALAHGVVFAESVTVSFTITDLMKTASRRPRPYAQADGFVAEAGDDQWSFPSGHTSTAGAVGFSLAHQIASTSDLSTGTRVGLYGAATALTATTGALRVAASKHYPTDVLMGGLLGASVGIVVPELHRRSPVQVTANVDGDRRLVGVSGVW